MQRTNRSLISSSACLLTLALSACSSGTADTPDAPQASAPYTVAEDMPDMLFVALDGGTYRRGNADLHAFHCATPVHDVSVSPFSIQTHPVTNAQYAAFVEATGYVTWAEREFSPELFPGLSAAELALVEQNYEPGALVFTAPAANTSNLHDVSQWWVFTPGACWNHPFGPDSSLEGLENHPVVQIAWPDALAYAAWFSEKYNVNADLPTEAEWEFAARGGRDQARYIWGDTPDETGEFSNIWQGNFPNHNDLTDGYALTNEVGAFPANGFGLHDMSGNVWEWCLDGWDPRAYSRLSRQEDIPTDPMTPPQTGYERVVRGGSFLCSAVYCHGYLPGARMHSSPDTALSHTGFRLVIRADSHPLTSSGSQ